VYRENIRVHAVSPGAVTTDMLPVIKPDWTGDEQMLDPKDIAGIIAFLLEQRMTNAVIDEVMVNRSTKEPFVV
jgi:NAD(P)-dependent dehydrogenase (short-subunit alcohol dehydrogenase family)